MQDFKILNRRKKFRSVVCRVQNYLPYMPTYKLQNLAAKIIRLNPKRITNNFILEYLQKNSNI